MSVIVRRGAAPSSLGALLERLAAQEHRALEVLVAGARPGDPDAATLALQPAPVAVVAGEGTAALNRALERARGDLLVFVAEAERPGPRWLAAHVEAHRTGPTACVLGPCLATDAAMPALATSSGLSFEACGPRLEVEPEAFLSGQHYGWHAFLAHNLSLPRSALGTSRFAEEGFADGAGADLELGYRIARGGLRVRFEAAAGTVPQGPGRLEFAAWLAGRLEAGRARARVALRHPGAAVPGVPAGRRVDEPGVLRAMVERIEMGWPPLARLGDFAERHGLEAIPSAERATAILNLHTLGRLAAYRGVVREVCGRDPGEVVRNGPSRGALTSVVVVSHDGCAMTLACLERLRRHREPDHPIEIIVVDNGSRDGSREMLAAQPDVRLIANGSNLGAPRARNQALAVARGDAVAFLDNDALVSAGWLGRLRYHLEVDPRCGFVGPVTDRASHGQVVAGAPPADAEPDAFAAEIAERHHRRHGAAQLMSSFCILARRDLLDRLGGFDPRFSPWGFEDDDITLRALLAGANNRLAGDVFVQHRPYGGPRLAHHRKLLARNWRRFAAKWGLGADAPYGGRPGDIERVIGRRWDEAALRVDREAPEPGDAEALTPAPLAPVSPPAATARAAGASAAPLPAPDGAAPAGLDLSVIVPTYDRPDLVDQLLRSLCAQTLAPHRFELILVDDGSPRPLAIDVTRYRFPITLLRQPNAGPAAARNLALARCRAPLTLILNDDAVPAPDDLEEHLLAHRGLGGDRPVAVLGTFEFVDEARRQPFVQLVEDSSLLFDYVSMRDGGRYGWTFFWTCNLSLPTEVLRRSGGFDAGRFREAIVEDVELGYRLQRDHGLEVLHRRRARCGHDHPLPAAAWFRRMVRLGVNLTRMYRKHGDPSVLWRAPEFRLDGPTLDAMQREAERDAPRLREGIAEVLRFESKHAGQRLAPETLGPWRERLAELGRLCTNAGILLEARGSRIGEVGQEGPPAALRVTLLVYGDEGARIERTLAALDRHTPRERVAETLVARGTDLAAAGLTARDRAKGDWVVFLRAGLEVGPRWLERLLYHLAVEDRVGAVGSLATGAAFGQAPERMPPGVSSPAGLDSWLGAQGERPYRYQRLLAGELLAVRRRVLDELDGFDGRLAGSGLEAADLSLRAHLAGWRNRVVLDLLAWWDGEPPRGPDPAAAWPRLARRWGLEGLRHGDFAGLVAHLEDPERAALRPAAGEPPVGPADEEPPLVSLCMIVRDEAESLERCLASAAGVAGEIVVVDTGSKDRSVEIAERAGARVVRVPWQDDFAAARNRALDEARGLWVLSLDADEELRAEGRKELRDLLAARPAGRLRGYLVAVRNLSDSGDPATLHTSLAPRLFPRHPRVRWSGTIHEQLVHLDGPDRLELVRTEAIEILHHGYKKSVMAARGKGARNRRLIERALERRETDPFLHFCLGQTLAESGEPEAALAALEKARRLAGALPAPPSWLPYVYALATGAALDLGEHERGVALGTEGMAATGGEYPDLLCNLAGCHGARGEVERALELYRRARSLHGRPSALGGDAGATTWRPLLGIGNLLLAGGDPAGALAAYREGLEHAPSHPRLRLRAAQAALAAGDRAEAERRFRELVAAEPDLDEARIGLVDLKITGGDVEAALEELGELVAARPHSVPLRAHLADLLAGCGLRDQALTVLGAAMHLETPSSLLYVKLADLLRDLERPVDALRAYTLALAADPRSRDARAGMAAMGQRLAAAGAGPVPAKGG